MTQKKVVPFPVATPSPVSDSTSSLHDRMILRIGRQSLAFDFYSTVTELNPEPALVVPFGKGKRFKGKCGKRRLRGPAPDGTVGDNFDNGVVG